MSESRRSVAALTAGLLGVAITLTGCSDGSAARERTAQSTTSSPSATSAATPAGTSSAKPSSTSPMPAVSQEAVVSRLPGPADGSCTTTIARNLRSGGLGAGDFDLARKTYKNGGKGVEPATVTLHIIPAHPGKMSGLSVNATRLRKPVWYRQASTTTTGTTAGGVRYYVLTFNVPVPGNWRLEMTAGVDKGCFEVAFNRPA